MGWYRRLASFLREKTVAEGLDLELRHQQQLLTALNDFGAAVKGDARATYEQRLQVRTRCAGSGNHGGRCSTQAARRICPIPQKLISEHYTVVRTTNEAASERECQVIADAVVQQITYATSHQRRVAAAHLMSCQMAPCVWTRRPFVRTALSYKTGR